MGCAVERRLVTLASWGGDPWGEDELIQNPFKLTSYGDHSITYKENYSHTKTSQAAEATKGMWIRRITSYSYAKMQSLLRELLNPT